MRWYRSGCRDPVCTFESYDPVTREVGHYDKNWTTITSPEEDRMLYPAPVSAPTSPSDAVPDGTPDRYDEMATSIIDRLPETVRLSTLRIKPDECTVCGTNTRMSVLVNSDRMPETGGPIYAEACDYCLGRVCMKLTHTGIKVSGLGADDDDEN